MVTVLPKLIVTKVPVTLFITLLVNAMEIRRDTNMSMSHRYPAIIYLLKLTIETLEKGVGNVQS